MHKDGEQIGEAKREIGADDYRSLVEQELHTTKDYLKTVFNKIHDALFVHDFTGKVVDVNDKMLDLYKISREEAIGLSIVPDYSSLDNPLLNYTPVFWEKVMAGEDQQFEWKARRPGDGSVFDVEVCLSKLSLPNGDFVLASCRDITDRKKVELELRGTKEYLKTVLNNIRDATYIIDLKGNIRDVNDKMLEMHGCTREEAVGATIRDFSADDNPFDEMPHINTKVIGGEDQYFEWKCKRPRDGSTIDVEVYLSKLSLPDGDFILANVHDISERKKLDRELRAAKDYLKTVFNKIHDALFVHDFTGKIIDVNEKMLELYRISREEAIGLSIVPDYSSSENLLFGSQYLLWEKVMAGEDQQFEWKARRPGDGSVFDVEVCLTKLSLPNGDFVLASCRDITDRKKVELELRGTKEYLKTVLNNIRDATYIHDFRGRIKDVNDRMLEMHDCTREEAVGATVMDFSADDNPFDEMLHVLPKIIGGEDQYFEWKCKRPKDGSTIDVEVYATKLSLPDGDFILANVHDISERKKLDRELRAAKDYLGTVFNKIHDALFVFDLKGILLDVNEKVLELYKCTRKEAIGAHIHSDFSAPDKPLLDYHREVLWERVMAGEDQLFEWKARRPNDGSTFDVEVCLTKLSLPHGDFILASCRDITRRKGAEELLIKEKEVFFSVMNDNPHGIALFDNSGRFVYFNPEFSAITGYTIDDVPTGREWAQKAYPDPEYRAKAVAFWKADKLPEGRGKDVEWRITCRNGQEKDVEFRVTYLGDKSLVVLTDTTARKRAEEDLRAEKQKFQTLCESSPMGLMKVDTDDRVTYINPKFKELLGYDLIDIPDLKSWFIRAYPDPSYRRKALSRRLRDLDTPELGEGTPFERKVACRDGGQKFINFIPVTLEAGEMLLTCEDITKSKEAERKVRERNMELEILNDVIASVNSSLHLSEILESLRKVFVEKLKIPVGGIFLYNETEKRLNMEMCWGISDALHYYFETFASSIYNRDTFFRENRVIMVKNQAHFLTAVSSPVNTFLHDWNRYLCAPLSAKGEYQGMILLIDKASGTLRDDQIVFFQTLAQQIGVAMQNARLFEQVQQSHSEMKALSLRLVEVQEAELRHIARELHDEVGQLLTGLRLALEMALQSPGDPTASLLEARTHANTLTGLVRELSRNLRPSMLDDLGLLPTLPWLFERFSAQTNVRVIFEHSNIGSKRFPHEIETAVYRIAQEALTNVARHAGIGVVTVRLWSNEITLGVQIEDQGIGFDSLSVLRAGTSNGLAGMRERVTLLGGRFTLDTGPGSGTRVTAELPLEAEGI